MHPKFQHASTSLIQSNITPWINACEGNYPSPRILLRLLNDPVVQLFNGDFHWKYVHEVQRKNTHEIGVAKLRFSCVQCLNEFL